MVDLPLPPGSTIGIFGGGQLGRMLAMAAADLGFVSHIYCDAEGSCASQVAARTTVAGYDDLAALRSFASAIDVATFEFENIPTEALEFISSHTRLAPGANTLKATRDRLVEKEFIEGLGIAVAPFVDIDLLGSHNPDPDTDFDKISNRIRFPALLKSRRFGYDGKGQIRVSSIDELRAAVDDLGNTPSIIEEIISFECELSVIAVRDGAGAMLFYDLTENNHEGGILRRAQVPAKAAPEVHEKARELASIIASKLDFVGTFAVEYFYCGADAGQPLIVNEVAPRVHNTGHWTIDAALTSQFENHIRAIAGWPLASTERIADAVMTNLIGDDLLDWPALSASAENALHIYGKDEIREGRKMAHVTRLSPRTR